VEIDLFGQNIKNKFYGKKGSLEGEKKSQEFS